MNWKWPDQPPGLALHQRHIRARAALQGADKPEKASPFLRRSAEASKPAVPIRGLCRNFVIPVGLPFPRPKSLPPPSEAEALHIPVQARVKLLSRGAPRAQPRAEQRREAAGGPVSFPQARFFPPLQLPLGAGFWPAFPLLGRFPPQRVKFRTWSLPRRVFSAPSTAFPWKGMETPKDTEFAGTAGNPAKRARAEGSPPATGWFAAGFRRSSGPSVPGLRLLLLGRERQPSGRARLKGKQSEEASRRSGFGPCFPPCDQGLFPVG